jgi:hypothetical protein
LFGIGKEDDLVINIQDTWFSYFGGDNYYSPFEKMNLCNLIFSKLTTIVLTNLPYDSKEFTDNLSNPENFELINYICRFLDYGEKLFIKNWYNLLVKHLDISKNYYLFQDEKFQSIISQKLNIILSNLNKTNLLDFSVNDDRKILRIDLMELLMEIIIQSNQVRDFNSKISEKRNNLLNKLAKLNNFKGSEKEKKEELKKLKEKLSKFNEKHPDMILFKDSSIVINVNFI